MSLSTVVCREEAKCLFVPDNNHTTQENTGGVWFFIAATPKHHENAPREKGAWTMQVREPRMAENRASTVIDSSEKFL